MSSSERAVTEREIAQFFVEYVKQRIFYAKGQLISLKPSRLADELTSERKDLEAKYRSISRALLELLEHLRDFGMVQMVKKTKRGRVYALQRGSLLWQVIQHGNLDCVADVLA